MHSGRRMIPAVAGGLAAAALLASGCAGQAAPARPRAGQMAARQAAANPDVDPGTRLPGIPAPGFTLTDQHGQPVSLRQFRGRAVVLAFVDSRCTTVCPLTTVAMTEAVRMLGPAGRRVQLLGIDANPDATAVADVRAYSVAHQMPSSWHFLTGSRRQLAAVWHAYRVYVAASHGNIDHEPAIYLISPDSRERMLFLSQMAYAGVAPQAELLARGLSGLLPGHPAVRADLPMAAARGIAPAAAAALPVIAGRRPPGQARLGAGHPHVVVFWASWLSEVGNVPAGLRALARYQAAAARRGWPPAVAVDETATEDGTAAPARLAAAAGGAKLGYPVAADSSGRLADGYGVQDLPWTEVISASGHVVFRHDGWLSTAALERAAARASRG